MKKELFVLTNFFTFQVLSFFTSRLDVAQRQPSVTEVNDIIKQGAVQFKRDRLKVKGFENVIRKVDNKKIAYRESFWEGKHNLTLKIGLLFTPILDFLFLKLSIPRFKRKI